MEGYVGLQQINSPSIKPLKTREEKENSKPTGRTVYCSYFDEVRNIVNTFSVTEAFLDSWEIRVK